MSEDYKGRIGNLIRDARKHRGWTQQQLADELGSVREIVSRLLRSFEQSPLSKANFGALKGLSEAALEALLTQARQERGSR